MIRHFGLGSFHDVHFLNADTAFWVTTENAIAKTEDGWETWEFIEIIDAEWPHHNSLLSLSMLENGFGIAVGNNLCVWQTEDFGDSWQKLKSGGTFTSKYNYAHLINENEVLYKSGTLKKGDPDFNAFQVVINSGSGWVKQQSDQSFLLIQDDQTFHVHSDGQTILKEWEKPPTWNNDECVDASIIDTLHGFALMDGGDLYVSDDGSETWTEIDYPGHSDYISFLNTDTGIVMKGLLTTHDGGDTWHGFNFDSLWSVQPNQVDADLREVVWISHEVVYALGPNGLILKSEDAGMHWELKSALLANAKEPQFYADSLGIITSGYGLIHSNDHGQSWEYQAFDDLAYEDWEFFSGHQWSADVGLVSALIDYTPDTTFRSIDGWQTREPVLNDGLHSIWFVNDTLGYGGGYDTSYVTIDSGKTWTVMSGLNGQNVRNIEFYNDQFGLAAARNDGLYYTSNGGVNWTLSNASGLIEDATIANDSVAFAVTYQNNILKSADSGATWSVVHTPEHSAHLEEVIAIGNKVVAVGHEGQISTSNDLGNTWYDYSIGYHIYLDFVGYGQNRFWITGDMGLVSIDSCLGSLAWDQDTICHGDTLELAVQGLSGNKQWYLNGTLISSGIADTIHWVGLQRGDEIRVNNGNCEVKRLLEISVFDTNATIYASPQNVYSQDTVFCSGVRYLNAPRGTSYQWSTGATSSQIAVTSAGVYTVTVQAPCGQFVDSITMVQGAGPNHQIVEDTVCLSALQETDFINSTGHVYHWEGQGNSGLVSTPLDSMPHYVYTGSSSWPFDLTFDVTIIDTNNGCQTSFELDVLVHQSYAGFEAGNYYGCEGEIAYPIMYETWASYGYVYKWLDEDSLEVDTITESGIYYGYMESACESLYDTSIVSLEQFDPAIIEADTSLCDSGVIAYSTNSSGQEKVWLMSTPEDTVFYDSFSQTNGTSSTSFWTTTSSFSWCNCIATENGKLKATAATNGTTTTSLTTSSFNVDSALAIIITMQAWENIDLLNSSEYIKLIVNGIAGGLSQSDTITLQYFANPDKLEGDFDSTLLYGVLDQGYTSLSLFLEVKVHDDQESYRFDNLLVTQHESFSNVPNVSYLATESHDLLLYSRTGFCRALDTVSISVEPSLPQIVASDSLGCEGDSILLSIDSIGSGFSWSNGQTGASIWVYESGNYSASFVNTCGVVYTDTLSVLIHDNPIVSLTGPDSSCANEFDTLSAGGGLFYQWSTASADSVIIVNPQNQTAYYVTVSDSNCSSVDSITIVSLEPPQVQFTGVLEACKGDTLTFNAIADSSLSLVWWNGVSGFVVETPFDSTHAYYVIASDGLCSDTAVQVVTELPQPSVLHIPEDTIVCLGDTIMLTASGSGLVSWLGYGTDSSIAVSPDSTMSFIAQAFDICYRFDTLIVDTWHLPKPTIQGDVGYCQGDTLLLHVPQSFDSYFWNTGDTVHQIQWTESDSNVVEVNVFNGQCFGQDVVELMQYPLAEAQFTMSQGADSISAQWLSPDSSMSFLWSFGDGSTNSIDDSVVHHYASPSLYKVCLSVIGQCNADSSCTDVMVGLREMLSYETFSLAPNPATDYMRIRFGNEESFAGNVEVFNALGDKVYQTRYHSGDAVYVGSMARGMYLLRIQTERKSAILRFTLQ